LIIKHTRDATYLWKHILGLRWKGRETERNLTEEIGVLETFGSDKNNLNSPFRHLANSGYSFRTRNVALNYREEMENQTIVFFWFSEDFEVINTWISFFFYRLPTFFQLIRHGEWSVRSCFIYLGSWPVFSHCWPSHIHT